MKEVLPSTSSNAFLSSIGITSGDCIWVTEFSSDAVVSFYEKFFEFERREDMRIIPVFINSYGGEVYALTAMRDLIKSSPKPVATIAVGMAMSCGASLLASGTKKLRFAAQTSHIMIHQVSGVAPGKAADITASAEVIAGLNKSLLAMLAKDSGTKLSKLEKEIHKRHNADWTLSTEEAKEWGIIDYIGIPRFWKNSLGPIEMILPPAFDEINMKVSSKVKPRKS